MDLLTSPKLENNGRPTWTVYRAAEYTSILMGQKHPEKKENREGYEYHYQTFDWEVRDLWRYLNQFIELTARTRNGPKPNVEKLFKTALSAYATRRLMLRHGGNYKVRLSAVEVSQSWYLIFGEDESEDNIKKYLPRLAHPLRIINQFFEPLQNSRLRPFHSLGRTLAYQFPDSNWY
ncbi:hypothetical protein [Arenibacterium halophilum]|uniref:Transposase n=1 Tax=Arenibacterium halophilum TaxID=2583821 RepID=A0ABY2WX82_9RHOB|nr:hypothetical protein [Arenibacterium halophilum]TMV07439.1 hypothetical protein FGK64_21460 [Arenibacterium halophilum]